MMWGSDPCAFGTLWLPTLFLVLVLCLCCNSFLSSHRLGLDGMKMQVRCCGIPAVTKRDPGMPGKDIPLPAQWLRGSDTACELSCAYLAAVMSLCSKSLATSSVTAVHRAG